MKNRKQRAVYFTDEDWELIEKAAKKTNSRSRTAYVERVLIRTAKRDVK